MQQRQDRALPAPQRSWWVHRSPADGRLRCSAPGCGGPATAPGRPAQEVIWAHLAEHARTEPLADHLRTCCCRAHGCTWHLRHRGCTGPLILVVFRRDQGRTWHLADTCAGCAHAIPHAAQVTAPAPAAETRDGGARARRRSPAAPADAMTALRAALDYLDAALGPTVPPPARLLALVCLLRADATGTARLPTGLLRALRLAGGADLLIGCLVQERWLLPQAAVPGSRPNAPGAGIAVLIADLTDGRAQPSATRRARRQALDHVMRLLTRPHLTGAEEGTRLSVQRAAPGPDRAALSPARGPQPPSRRTPSTSAASAAVRLTGRLPQGRAQDSHAWRKSMQDPSNDRGETMTVSQVRANLGPLVRWCARTGERLLITDRGQPAAVLVSVAELARLDTSSDLTSGTRTPGPTR